MRGEGYVLCQQVVRCGRHSNSFLLVPHRQQHAQREEQQVGRQERHAIGTHILLCPTQRFARQVFLHHVLIDTRHDQHDEHTTQKLFPEVLLRHPVIPHENARQLALTDGTDSISYAQVQVRRHLIYNKYKGRKQAERLHGVRPYQRLDASLTGVEPYQQHQQYRCQRKGHALWLEHEALQDDAHHIEPHGSTRHLRQQEEPRSRLVRTPSQSLSQIGIDRREVQLIVEWQQDKSHDNIAQDKAHARLQIVHLRRQHHAWHTDKGNARYRRTHHTEGHHIPRRPTVSPVERLVGSPSARPSAEGKQQGKISQYNSYYCHNCLQRYKIIDN